MPTSLEDLKRDHSVSPALLEALERLVFDCAEHTEARCIAAFLVLLARHSQRTVNPRFLQYLNTQCSFGRDTRVLRQRIIKEILP
jgi:hypothetical protein